MYSDFSRPFQGENLLGCGRFSHNGMRRKGTKDVFKVQFRINKDKEEHNRSEFGEEANELNLGHPHGKVQKSEVLVWNLGIMDSLLQFSTFILFGIYYNENQVQKKRNSGSLTNQKHGSLSYPISPEVGLVEGTTESGTQFLFLSDFLSQSYLVAQEGCWSFSHHIHSPINRKGKEDKRACPLPLETLPINCTYHFYFHPIGQDLVNGYTYLQEWLGYMVFILTTHVLS